MKHIVAVDWDGVCVDTMGDLIEIARLCIQRNLGLVFSKKEVAEKAMQFSGIPVSKSLPMIFPNSDAEDLNNCIREFNEALLTMEIKTFPGVRETFQRLVDRDVEVVISSAAPKSLIERWARKENLAHLLGGTYEGRIYEGIYGEEDGSKEDHINNIRKKCSHCCQVIFVSDSLRDMGFGDAAIGFLPEGQGVKFFDAGAIAVIHSLPEILGWDIRAI